MIALALMAAAAFAGEDQSSRKAGQVIGDTIANPSEIDSDAGRMDRFVIFNQKLKSAVCDEAVISKAPSLDAISTPGDERITRFSVAAPPGTSEAELVSFLLGDSLAGFYSDYVRSRFGEALAGRGLEAHQSQAWGFSGQQLVDAQALMAGVKRDVSLDICGGVVQLARLRQLLNTRPSRFLEATVDDAGAARGHGPSDERFVARVIDSSGRFARVGERGKGGSSARFLVPGWLESFEIEQVAMFDAKGQSQRAYRRLFNPLTNETQGIEVVSRDGVPIGVLFVSHEPTPADWASFRETADQSATRARQVETYRQRIELDAMEFLARHPERGDSARDVQEFYKQLLKAYQLFPNEKQFDAYAKATASRRLATLEDVTRKALGEPFLEALRQARVNGGFVHVALFKPDPKLHAIYVEFQARLAKLAR